MDLDARIWILPGVRSKTGRDHMVPLSPMALAALDDTRRYADGGPLVFPSPRGRALRQKHLSELLRAPQVDAVPHGFRSSFRDWAAECTDARARSASSLWRTSTATASKPPTSPERAAQAHRGPAAAESA